MKMWARICRGAALAGACVFTGCATLPEAPAKEGTAATAPSPPQSPSPQAIANAQRLAGAPGSSPPPAPAPAPSALRTFADVSRDAKELTGLFRLWQKDDKVWLEMAPDQFDHAYFFSTNLDQGLGESRFLAGSMSSSLSRRFGGPAIVVFRKIGGNVQMIARNVKYTAQAGTPEARAVADAFSDSLLATAAIASQPHPERKSVLVEANALFFTDLTGAASRLEQSYRQSYAFDARNSSFREVHSTPDFVSFNVMAHYALARVVIPQPGQHGHRTTVHGPRHPQPVPGLSLFAGQAAGHADAAACRRSAHRLFRHRRLGFHDRRSPHPDRPLREPLAPGEEGPGRRVVGAEAADRLLDRPQRAGEVSRVDP